MPGVFSDQIDVKNKVEYSPIPPGIQDIDIDRTMLDDFDIVTDNGRDINTLTQLSNFNNISYNRNSLYEAIDSMCEDARISAAVEIYTSVACEPNASGHIMWAESADVNINNYINYLLDAFNVDKYAYQWMCSLVKYGDLYLRLYRESETEDYSKNKKTLNEDIKLKLFRDDDKVIDFIEMHRNPAEVFDLQKRGKTVGYIRTHLPDTINTTDDFMYSSTFLNRYKFNTNDVDLYQADTYVHACLADPNIKYTEEVVLNYADDETKEVTYTVRRGRSLLYDAYKIWKTLSLLENAVLLNRITKSSVVKVVSVDTGDMDKTKVRPYLQQLRQSIETKVAIDVGNNMTEGVNYSPVENMIFLPQHEGKNAITVTDIGTGEVNPQLGDIDYFRKKLFSALGIPGAYLGEDDGESGFDSGVNLTLKSSQFAKKIKKLQNALVQAVTDAINLILYNKKMYSYINEFTIKMQQPLTQEEQDRKDSLVNTISAIDSQMRLIEDSGVENPITKLEMLKIYLSEAGINPDVIALLEKEIQSMKEGETLAGDSGESSGGGDFGGEDLGDLDFGDEGTEDLGGADETDLGTEDQTNGAEEIDLGTEEGFTQGRGQTLLNERNSLPSWSDLGVSYTDVKL